MHNYGPFCLQLLKEEPDRSVVKYSFVDQTEHVVSLAPRKTRYSLPHHQITRVYNNYWHKNTKCLNLILAVYSGFLILLRCYQSVDCHKLSIRCCDWIKTMASVCVWLDYCAVPLIPGLIRVRNFYLSTLYLWNWETNPNHPLVLTTFWLIQLTPAILLWHFRPSGCFSWYLRPFAWHLHYHYEKRAQDVREIWLFYYTSCLRRSDQNTALFLTWEPKYIRPSLPTCDSQTVVSNTNFISLIFCG